MSQTLESIAAPGATPIANNAASSKSFANDYFKLAVPNLSTRDRKTIWILGLIYELTHAGGANYKTNHAGLIQDAQVYSGGISLFDLVVALSADAWSAGRAADATLSNDLGALLQAGNDLKQLAEEQQDRIIAFLRAQLAV